MTEDELADRIFHRKLLEQQQDHPVVAYDPTSDMTESEVRKHCNFLMEQASANDKMSNDILNELRELRKENASREKNLYAIISSLEAKIGNYEVQSAGYQKESHALRKKRDNLLDRLSVLNGEHFGSSKSQKGMTRKSAHKGRNDDKDNFDGTAGSLSSGSVDNIPSDGQSFLSGD